MPIEIAAHAGFCMGVRRAVESAVQVADSGVPSCTLGELIHNPTVVDMLRQRGIPPVASAEEAAGRQVLIRSHGVAPEVIKQLENAGCKVVDLTCPFVNKLHRVVAEDTSEDCPLIMVGEREHPEVKGTCGWARGKVYVVATAEEAAQLPEMDQAAAAVQTTFPPERWEAIVAVLRGRVQHRLDAELDRHERTLAEIGPDVADLITPVRELLSGDSGALDRLEFAFKYGF